jgi:hypothetical protein
MQTNLSKAVSLVQCRFKIALLRTLKLTEPSNHRESIKLPEIPSYLLIALVGKDKQKRDKVLQVYNLWY